MNAFPLDYHNVNDNGVTQLVNLAHTYTIRVNWPGSFNTAHAELAAVRQNEPTEAG